MSHRWDEADHRQTSQASKIGLQWCHVFCAKHLRAHVDKEQTLVCQMLMFGSSKSHAGESGLADNIADESPKFDIEASSCLFFRRRGETDRGQVSRDSQAALQRSVCPEVGVQRHGRATRGAPFPRRRNRRQARERRAPRTALAVFGVRQSRRGFAGGYYDIV